MLNNKYSLTLFKSEIYNKKNIRNHARLGDIIGSSYMYPLNPCNCTSIKGMFIPSVHATFYRNGKHSFQVILEIAK